MLDGYSHGINTSITECLHARIVIQRRVNAIGTNCIDTKLLQVGKITGTGSAIRQGIDESGRFKEGIACACDHRTCIPL